MSRHGVLEFSAFFKGFSLCCFLSLLVSPQVDAFSSGKAITKGPILLRGLYCGRKPLHRAPFHLNTTGCGGYCPARLDTEDKFVVEISAKTYWDGPVNGERLQGVGRCVASCWLLADTYCTTGCGWMCNTLEKDVMCSILLGLCGCVMYCWMRMDVWYTARCEWM